MNNYDNKTSNTNYHWFFAKLHSRWIYMYIKHVQLWSLSLAGLCRFSCVVYCYFRDFSLSKNFYYYLLYQKTWTHTYTHHCVKHVSYVFLASLVPPGPFPALQCSALFIKAVLIN